MTTLQELREAWERTGVEELCVVHNDQGYVRVFVIVSFWRKDETTPYKYQLLRYFQIGENWEVSVDKDADGDDRVGVFEEMCSFVTDQFKDIYPKS